jgi:outer membrane protein OmpA-like peptidoglycan-associated protein
LLGLALHAPAARANPMDASDMGTPTPARAPRFVRRELDRAETLLRKKLRAEPEYADLELLREPKRLLLRSPAYFWFAPDSVMLRPLNAPPTAGMLEMVTLVLQRRKELQAQVGVYTDAIGEPAANLSFSQQRASAIVAALQSRTPQTDRIAGFGGGESAALDVNGTPEGRTRNRRVEIAFGLTPPAPSTSSP